MALKISDLGTTLWIRKYIQFYDENFLSEIMGWSLYLIMTNSWDYQITTFGLSGNEY